jgi:hypothetical protein
MEDERAAEVADRPDVFRLGFVAGLAHPREPGVDAVDEQAELMDAGVRVAQVFGGRALDGRILALLELDD